MVVAISEPPSAETAPGLSCSGCGSSATRVKPTLSVNQAIAMGYVETQYSAPGTPLEAEVRGKRVPLTVETMPFIPHRYHRKGAAR